MLALRVCAAAEEPLAGGPPGPGHSGPHDTLLAFRTGFAITLKRFEPFRLLYTITSRRPIRPDGVRAGRIPVATQKGLAFVRSEGRRVGKECVSKVRSRWASYI